MILQEDKIGFLPGIWVLKIWPNTQMGNPLKIKNLGSKLKGPPKYK